MRQQRWLWVAFLVLVWVRLAAPGVASPRGECSNSTECSGDWVCDPSDDGGTCKPCGEYPDGCDDYEVYSNLTDPFCDEQSGRCWENTDCLAPGLNWVGDPCQNACAPCDNQNGCPYDCPDGWVCDSEFNPGQCRYAAR